MRTCRGCGVEKAEDQFRHYTQTGRRGWVDGTCRDCRRKMDTEQKRARRSAPKAQQDYRTYMRQYAKRERADLQYARSRLEKRGGYLYGVVCLDCGMEVPENRCLDVVAYSVDEVINVHPSCPECGSKWLAPYTRRRVKR